MIHELWIDDYLGLQATIDIWCVQNSCMNFLVYWYIFQYIYMLWDVIIMFFIDLWRFSINPLILVITLQNRKYLFCVFWWFRDFPKPKLSENFYGVNIFTWEPTWDKEAHEWATKAKTSTCSTGPLLGRTTRCRLVLEPSMSSIFAPDQFSWCKKSYINTPQGVPSKRRQKNTKPWSRGCTCEDWRGKRCQNCPSHFSNITNTATMMKRE
jgi:hypothetical protein